jgi:hypothetical protein
VQVFLDEYMGRLRAIMPGICVEDNEPIKDWTGLARRVPWANDDDDPQEFESGPFIDVATSAFEKLLDPPDPDESEYVVEPIVEFEVGAGLSDFCKLDQNVDL